MVLELRLSYASGQFDTSFGLGDVSLKFTHVLDANPSRGLAYTAELPFYTVDRADLGAGQTVLELYGFYVKFLKNGSIFTPALVQTFGLGDEMRTLGATLSTQLQSIFIISRKPNTI